MFLPVVAGYRKLNLIYKIKIKKLNNTSFGDAKNLKFIY
jgi:hypothetical protein